MGKHWYSINLYDNPRTIYMVNTRATLWFDIVLDCLPSQHDGFRCHSFTIRDALALTVFVRLNSIFLVCSPALLTAGRLAISRRPSLPSRTRKRLLSRLQFTYSYHIYISPYSLSYVLGVIWGAITTSPPWTVILLTITVTIAIRRATALCRLRFNLLHLRYMTISPVHSVSVFRSGGRRFKLHRMQTFIEITLCRLEPNLSTS